MYQSAAFSPDGKRILTTSDDKTARLMECRTGKVSEPLEGHDRLCRTWDRARLAPTASASLPRPMTRRRDCGTARPASKSANRSKATKIVVKRAAFSPDGKRIVTASEDKTARLWDGETGKAIGDPLKVMRILY